MNIRWHEPNCPEDLRIFDTLWEAVEWGDSISNDINAGAFDGYITSDEKVAYVLAFHLAQIDRFHVHAEKSWSDGRYNYKVWVTRLLHY